MTTWLVSSNPASTSGMSVSSKNCHGPHVVLEIEILNRTGVSDVEAPPRAAARDHDHLVDVRDALGKVMHEQPHVGQRTDRGNRQALVAQQLRDVLNGGVGGWQRPVLRQRRRGAAPYRHVGLLQHDQLTRNAIDVGERRVAVNGRNGAQIDGVDVERLDDREPVVDVARSAFVQNAECDVGIDDDSGGHEAMTN